MQAPDLLIGDVREFFRGARGHQDQPVHPVGPIERQRHRDPPAQRNTGQVGAGQAEPVHQAGDVGSHLFNRVRADRLGRAARTAVVDGGDLERGGQWAGQHAHLGHVQAQPAE